MKTHILLLLLLPACSYEPHAQPTLARTSKKLVQAAEAFVQRLPDKTLRAQATAFVEHLPETVQAQAAEFVARLPEAVQTKALAYFQQHSYPLDAFDFVQAHREPEQALEFLQSLRQKNKHCPCRGRKRK